MNTINTHFVGGVSGLGALLLWMVVELPVEENMRKIAKVIGGYHPISMHEKEKTQASYDDCNISCIDDVSFSLQVW